MKQGTTMFLRVVVYLIGLFILGICVFALPMAIRSGETGYYLPILLGLYVPVIPFFIALYQALKLLKYIDTSEAFSQLSVDALKNIKYDAFVISALFIGGMPYIYYVAELDDAPGVILIGLIIIFASGVIGVFAALLQGLLQQAIDIKAENDLTV